MNAIAPFDATWTIIPILFLVIGMVVVVLVVLLIAWILYTVVWKGVKRGLEEFYGVRAHRDSPAQYFGFATWSPPEGSSTPAPGDVVPGDRRDRSGRPPR